MLATMSKLFSPKGRFSGAVRHLWAECAFGVVVGALVSGVGF